MPDLDWTALLAVGGFVASLFLGVASILNSRAIARLSRQINGGGDR